MIDPIMLDPVPFFDLTRQWPRVREDVEAAIAPLFDSQAWILGEAVERFEEALAQACEAEHAIGVTSGTDALLLILRALQLEPRDEVIVPSFTFFATAGTVWNAGLTPVFCDVDPDTFNVTPESVQAVWSERTRAVIAVDLYGQMAPIAPLRTLCDERGAVLIGDAAQSFGARVGDLVAGSGAGAHATAHSFYPTKNLGAFGDAGAVTTSDQALAERVWLHRVHGAPRSYEHEIVGTNARIDAMQAAILRAKLPHVEDWLLRRGENACRYQGLLDGVDGVTLPAVTPDARHTYNQYTIRTDRRDELRAHLGERGIGSAIYYPIPLHRQECFASLPDAQRSLPTSERLSETVLSLPIFPELTDDEVDRAAEAVRSFFE